MPVIDREQLKELREEIYIEFSHLAEMLKTYPEAYRLCYVLNGKVISFSESALILAENHRAVPTIT